MADLIYVQKRENISLEHLRTLVRLKSTTVFPVDLIEDVGLRSFKVILYDDGVPTLRSKIIQRKITASSTQAKNHPPEPHTYTLWSSRSTYQLSKELKGKDPQLQDHPPEPHGRTVECGSCLGYISGSKESLSSDKTLLAIKDNFSDERQPTVP